MAAATGLIIFSCWIIFLIYWLVSAFRQKPVAERRSFSSMVGYRAPLSLGGLLLLFPGFRHPPFTWSLTPQTDSVRIMGAAICVFGLAVTLWARSTLGANWSSEVAFKKGHELIRKGPYRFVRHPIYSGLLLMCLGSAIPVGELRSWLGFVLLVAGFWIKLRQEERLMLRHFPDQYPAYRKEVKAVVPFVI